MDKPRFIGYIRVSTKGQEASGLGLEAQQALIRRHVAWANGELMEEFREAESGKRNDRPELRTALDRCKQTGATLLIAKLDRLARKVHFISCLMESGVDFLACDRPTKDRFMLHVDAAFAEEEGRRISARTKEGLGARRARGLPLGEKTHKHSWTPRKAIARWKNAQKATEARMAAMRTQKGPTIKRVVDLKLGGLSLGQIAETLKNEGHRTVNGLVYDKTAVWKILRREGVETQEHGNHTLAMQRYPLVLPRILQLLKEGLSQGKTADRLNAEGIKKQSGGPWTRMDVWRILKACGHTDPTQERRERARQVTDPILSELYSHGLSGNAIAEYLNEAEIPNTEGRPWNPETVRLQLRRMGIYNPFSADEVKARAFILDRMERERIREKYFELSGRIER
jgi:DNA invertase Pin-like site-specific DNA recombinase